MSSSNWVSHRKQSKSNNDKGPLIGKLVVVGGSHTSYAGIEGTIVDETMHTVVIRTTLGDKTVPKRGCVFKIGHALLDGNDMKSRPEERLKRKRKT